MLCAQAVSTCSPCLSSTPCQYRWIIDETRRAQVVSPIHGDTTILLLHGTSHTTRPLSRLQVFGDVGDFKVHVAEFPSVAIYHEPDHMDPKRDPAWTNT